MRRNDLSPRTCAAFTLFEMMMAIAVLALVFTAVTVSLRGKWRAEEARRGAQRLALAWSKARSHAQREGRDWEVAWEAEKAKIHGFPAVQPGGEGGGVSSGEEKGRDFEFEVGRSLRLASGKTGVELAPARFFANGRAAPCVVVVSAPGTPSWQVRMEWDARPVIERASQESGP
ncbi:MAG: pilus assembly FimT family protein [Verrucomicrobiia bacterium]